MIVWTLNAQNQRVAMPILNVTSVPVPASHLMVHFSFGNGRELIVSPGHPTADGRFVEQMVSGTPYEGEPIHSARIERYQTNDLRTFDLLPAGDTGFYWANGILLASTLR